MLITPLQKWIGTKIDNRLSEFNRNSLEQYQLERLQNTIAYVRQHSPFYRQLFANTSGQISRLSDLANYPFTTASEIQEDPNRFLCVSQDEIQRIVTLPTSGTTGPSKRIFFTAADQELTVDFFKVGMSTLARPGDRVLILLPGTRPGSVGDLLRIGLERLGCVPFPHGPFEDEGAVLRLIRENNVNVLVGAPIQLQRLFCWNQADLVLKSGQIRSVLSATDILPESIHQNLERHWKCEVFDHYGMTETGLGGGVECAAHQGYHLREADLYYEIIDPDTHTVLPDGETGEVVFSTLTRRGMPLIRYRTGDISRLLPGNCTCGSFIQRLERIQSRIQAGISINSGLLFPSNLDNVLFRIEGILDFSATIEKDPSNEVIVLEVQFLRERIQDIKDQIINSLNKIPVIRIGLEDKSLKVMVSEVDKLKIQRDRMNKRSILDRR